MPVPPYLRIVDDIRALVAAGDLRPGDRVPSARRITRDWGVAVATATKALAVLQREGLTTVRRGVGTVVAEPSPSPRAPARRATTPPRRSGDDDPDRQRIVLAAIDIADADGMAEVSMRRIAAALDVPTMSLYRHVRGKDELVLFMIDAALGEDSFPAERPDGWRPRLELSARLQWRMFRRHPWLAPVMSLTRPQLAPNALRHTDWVLCAFDETGISGTDRMYLHVMLFSFVRGVATAFEPEVEAQRETGLTSDEWMETQTQVIESLAGALPGFRQLVTEDDFDLNLDALFEFGLARILDGVAAFRPALG